MDLTNCSPLRDIIVTGYKYSGVDLIHKTIVQLCACTSPVTMEIKLPNIACCEGHLPSEYTHLNLDHSTKIVFIVRNPKDIAVTEYKTHDLDTEQPFTNFNDFLYSFLNGQSHGLWSEHTRQWSAIFSQHPTSNLHLIYFDDLIKNFEHEVSRLCQYLNIHKDSVQISELCLTMRKESEQPQRKRRRTLNHTENGHRELFNEVGEWKTHFTVSLQEQFDSVISEQIKDTKLDLHKLLY